MVFLTRSLPFPPPHEAIKRIQEALRHVLPRDYLAFLSAANGGYARSPDGKRQYTFMYRRKDRTEPDMAMLQYIFPIGIASEPSSGAIIDVEECLLNLRVSEDGFPKNLLPVAQSDCGMILGMHLGGAKNGTVEAFSSDYSFADGGYFVANSFGEFIDGIFLHQW